MTGANSGLWPTGHGKDEEKGLSTVSNIATPAPSTISPSRFGYATGLSCRECGHSAPIGAQHACPDCFGPLEVSYDLPAVTREQIEAGAHNILR